MKITYYRVAFALFAASFSCKSYGSMPIKIELIYFVKFELPGKKPTVATFKKEWRDAMKRKDPSYHGKTKDFRDTDQWLEPTDTLKNRQYVSFAEHPLQPISTPNERPFPQTPSQASNVRIRTQVNRSIYVAPDTSVEMLRIMWLQEIQKWNKSYRPDLQTIQCIDITKGFYSAPLSEFQDISELKGIYIKTSALPCLNRAEAVGSATSGPPFGTGQPPPPTTYIG